MRHVSPFLPVPIFRPRVGTEYTELFPDTERCRSLGGTRRDNPPALSGGVHCAVVPSLRPPVTLATVRVCFVSITYTRGCTPLYGASFAARGRISPLTRPASNNRQSERGNGEI